MSSWHTELANKRSNHQKSIAPHSTRQHAERASGEREAWRRMALTDKQGPLVQRDNDAKCLRMNAKDPSLEITGTYPPALQPRRHARPPTQHGQRFNPYQRPHQKPRQRDVLSHQRPALAKLSTNTNITRYPVPRPVFGQKLDRSPAKTAIHHGSPKSHGNNASPRRLLWPGQHFSQPQPRINGQQRQQRDQHRLHVPQSPIADRQPLVLRRRSELLSPKPGARMSSRMTTDQKQRIVQRDNLSYAEQLYCPSNQAQSDRIRKSAQSKLHHLNSSREVHTLRNVIESTPLKETQWSLLERFVQKLPDSPPTLHMNESRFPENPGSPRAESPVGRFLRPERGAEPTPGDTRLSNVQSENPSVMRKMLRWEIWLYRIVLGTVILALNISLLIFYLFAPRHQYLLAFLVFMKSKDLLSTIAGILGMLSYAVRDLIWAPEDVNSKWIMSVVCAYAENELQIVKTIHSLTKQDLVQHKQVMCVILDGKNQDILTHFQRVTHMMERTYTTWKGVQSRLYIHAGFINGTPVILMRKAKNAGKKDTLILGHTLFNYPRDDAPMDLRLLRRDIFAHILPQLTGVEAFKAFDCVYATDADSNIHKNCLRELANALARNPKAIAACGIILAELDEGTEWTAWHLFQQFQYSFGQYVRRSAETVWGRVTCLPGPVTMMMVRPEMGAAISEYAAPITTANLFLHQVQYQGTDRRLTWCMLSQDKNLRTIQVTTAIGETIVPSSLDHYLSQRRRWAANAYFNDYMYTFGKNQHWITRLFGVIDIIRMSFVYYRVMNTALFLRSLIRIFYVAKILPTLILTKSPTVWFLLLMVMKEPLLRKRLHKLVLGIALNQFMSPALSVVVFSRVLLNMGNHAWGTTGASSKDTVAITLTDPVPSTPLPFWSPKKLSKLIRDALQPPLLPDSGSNSVIEKSSNGSELSFCTPTTTSAVPSIVSSLEDLKKSLTASLSPNAHSQHTPLSTSIAEVLSGTPRSQQISSDQNLQAASESTKQSAPMTPDPQMPTSPRDGMAQSTVRKRKRHPAIIEPPL